MSLGILLRFVSNSLNLLVLINYDYIPGVSFLFEAFLNLIDLFFKYLNFFIPDFAHSLLEIDELNFMLLLFLKQFVLQRLYKLFEIFFFFHQIFLYPESFIQYLLDFWVFITQSYVDLFYLFAVLLDLRS